MLAQAVRYCAAYLRMGGRSQGVRLVIVGALAAFLVPGCSGATTSAPAASPDRAIIQTPDRGVGSAPTAVAVSTRSGAVLGGTRESWIAAWGEPSRGATGELFQIQNVAVEASFKEGLARHIEVLFDREVPNDVARMRAREFFPRDARRWRWRSVQKSSQGQNPARLSR